MARSKGDAVYRLTAASDVVAVGAASAQSAVFGAFTDVVRVASTTNAWIAINDNPTAIAADGSAYLPANQVEYFSVKPGDRLAVIQDSAAGNISVTEMTR